MLGHCFAPLTVTNRIIQCDENNEEEAKNYTTTRGCSLTCQFVRLSACNSKLAYRCVCEREYRFKPQDKPARTGTKQIPTTITIRAVSSVTCTHLYEHSLAHTHTRAAKARTSTTATPLLLENAAYETKRRHSDVAICVQIRRKRTESSGSSTWVARALS